MLSVSRKGISGSYIGVGNKSRLELRVDVGNADSLDCVSGDIFFEENQCSFEFHHSFQTTNLILEDKLPEQILRGPVKVHRNNIVDIGRLDLTVPPSGELIAVYTLYRITQIGRQTALSLTFALQKVSNFFRRVNLEIESVSGVPLPVPFETSNHPQTPRDARAQTLTVSSVYAKAGIELNVKFGGEKISADEAGGDHRWTNEELHAAMKNHFDQHRDIPQWHLYLLLATKYVDPGVLGIMFDAATNDAFHRQGAAVFYEHPNIAQANGAERHREYLFTIVHELGHAFNFLHSFQKGFNEIHGILPRPAAMSWMNYPHLYPYGFAVPQGWDGTESFWTQFMFNFDEEELRHLRHNDRSEVIPGGMNFGAAGHFEERPFSRPTHSSEYRLELWVPSFVEFLQQVEGDVRLRNESDEIICIPPSLDLAAGHLQLLIQGPKDQYPKVYQHFTSACVRSGIRELKPSEAIYQEILPSYGRRKWFVDEPGTYKLQAVIKVPDGRRIYSNVRQLRVLVPDRKADKLATNFFDDDTGVYLGVEGSRCATLQKTKDNLDSLCGEISDSIIARQIRLTNALCQTRIFKDVAAGSVVQGNRTEAALEYIEEVGELNEDRISASAAHFSNIRLTRGLLTGAHACVVEGNQEQAKQIFNVVKKFLELVHAPESARTRVQELAQSMSLGAD